MSELVQYRLDDGVAFVTMDDGKVNVLSPSMLRELNSAFDHAQEAGAVVVLAGRTGVFSAGFDLKVMRADFRQASDMMAAGKQFLRHPHQQKIVEGEAKTLAATGPRRDQLPLDPIANPVRRNG